MCQRSLELIELYLELILARFGLLEVTSSTSSKEPDEGVREAISSIVYASPRTDIRELHIVREAFMQRYGRDWAIAVMDHQSNVSTRVMSKCTTTTPDQAWVDMYLYEIAKAYQVDWKPEGVLDLDRVNGEMDTAAQDANLRTTTLAPPEYDARDDPPGGSVLLPTAPSDAPHLVDIRSSTSHIPIVRASTPTNSGTNTPSTSTAALPAPPPTDPNQADHTIVIKATKPGQSTAQAQKAESNKQNAEEDSRFDVSLPSYTTLRWERHKG